MSKPSENYKVFKPDYDVHGALLKEFLMNFKDKSAESDPIHGHNKYMSQLQKIANGSSKVLEVHLTDLETFLSKDIVVYDALMKNTKRYVKILQEVVDNIMPKRSVDSIRNDHVIDTKDDILNLHRMQNLFNSDKSEKPVSKNNFIPPEILRK